MLRERWARRARDRVIVGTGLGGLLGLGVAALGPSTTGCIIPDECILVQTPGRDWCRLLTGAQMWPIGQPELAEAVQASGGGPPQGCACFNSAEHQVLSDGAPFEYLATLEATIEQAARNACDAAVPAGYDHDCYVEGPDGPALESPYLDGAGSCVGDCAYTGECGDPNPYECEEIDKGGETTGAEAEDPPALDAGAHIDCVDTTCDIDEGFARMLWSDPTLLLTERARFVHDPLLGRFRLVAVDPGSLAHELGLREGDVLESVDGVTIPDLDTALAVYVQNRDASALRVRVSRSSRWLDFSYTITR